MVGRSEWRPISVEGRGAALFDAPSADRSTATHFSRIHLLIQRFLPRKKGAKTEAHLNFRNSDIRILIQWQIIEKSALICIFICLFLAAVERIGFEYELLLVLCRKRAHTDLFGGVNQLNSC